MTLAQDDDLIMGMLSLLRDKKVINRYRATSSLPGRQFSGSWRLKGGLIPPTKALTVPGGYTVKLEPFDMRGVPGVSGNFFQILPFEQLQGDVVRGDFGVHRDARAPGTLGCIGLETVRGWSAVERDFASMLSEGFKRIPLVVEYS